MLSRLFGGETGVAKFILASRKRQRDFEEEIDNYHIDGEIKLRKSRLENIAQGNFILVSTVAAAGYA